MNHKVVVFTQPGCPPCDMLKLYLTAKGVPFEERDICCDKSAAHDLVHKYGSDSTPIVIVGDEVVEGFDPERLDHLLDPAP